MLYPHKTFSPASTIDEVLFSNSLNQNLCRKPPQLLEGFGWKHGGKTGNFKNNLLTCHSHPTKNPFSYWSQTEKNPLGCAGCGCALGKGLDQSYKV